MNKNFFSLYLRNNYILQDGIVKQLFGWKYSFQGVPNQDGKSQKFQGVRGYDKHHLERKFEEGRGSKAKVPSVGRGRSMGIFWNYTFSIDVGA